MPAWHCPPPSTACLAPGWLPTSRPRATHGPDRLAAPAARGPEHTSLTLAWRKAHCLPRPIALFLGIPAGTGAGLGAGDAWLPGLAPPLKAVLGPGNRHILQTCPSLVRLGRKACVRVGRREQSLPAGPLGGLRTAPAEAGWWRGSQPACNGVTLPGGQGGPHPPPAPRGFSSRETHELRVSSFPHPPRLPVCWAWCALRREHC